jgi:hypothetical protein
MSISKIQWFVGRGPVVVEVKKCSPLEAEMYSKINFEHLFRLPIFIDNR